MSTTVTPSRARGRATRASTTPGKLWLLRVGLVAACLAWGVLATLTVIQHATAAHDVSATDQSLGLDAQQLYQSLALAEGRSDLLEATQHGSSPAQTLAQADITALQARGDQTLNLISRTGDADFQQNFHAAQAALGADLNSAGAQSGAGGTAPIASARHAATAWFAVNQRAQQLDAAHDYGAETQLEIGSGAGTAGTLFGQLESDLDSAIHADQAVFASNAAAGSDAFTGLEAATVVAALVMAAGCGWGLTRRLAEYR